MIEGGLLRRLLVAMFLRQSVKVDAQVVDFRTEWSYTEMRQTTRNLL